MAQDWGKILKYTAVLAGGFCAVRVALKIKDGLPPVQAVKKLLTEDLNPASDKNIVYSGAVQSAVTWIQDKVMADPVAQMNRQAELRQAQLDNSAKAQDNFRAAEIRAENADGAASQAAENQMMKSQDVFRMLEHGTEQEIYQGAIFGLYPKAF